MSRTVKVFAVQDSFAGSVDENVDKAEHWIRKSAKDGANLVLLPELFEGPYFCQERRESHFDLARPRQGHPTLTRLQQLAKELSVVLPVSFFEKAGQSHYNSLVVFDSDGADLGLYRKSHLPDGPGYSEKYYFRPGDTGLKVFSTQAGTIGVGVCWDQWFPEAARIMALQGAELLLYPTAIGSEPAAPDADTRDPWRRVMIGHAVANAVPVIAANRIGKEQAIDFYGSSFIADQRGDLLADLDRESPGLAHATIDLDQVRTYRNGWGFFRDRRPDLYSSLSEE